MKKTSHLFSRTLNALFFLFPILVLYGCVTRIPPTDTERPKITLFISGRGFDYRCSAGSALPCPDTPNVAGVDTLTYRPDTIYLSTKTEEDRIVTLSVLVSDGGGVGDAKLILDPTGYTVLERSAGVVVEERALRLFAVTGDRAAPKTGLSLTIKILLDRLEGRPGGAGILVLGEGHDFGGASGTPNYITTIDRRIKTVAL